MFIRLITPVSLLFLCFTFGSLNALRSQTKLDMVAAELDRVMAAENIPAISVGIFYQGKLHFVNKGALNRESKQAVSENSLYQIASLGKILIGMITNSMLLEGQLDLNQPITDFLPPMFSQKRLEKLAAITLEHLLHHTSGFPQDARAGYRRKDGDAYRYEYTEENLFTDLQKLKIKTGNNYQYSNFGYALLAYILEQVSGLAYQDLLNKYITQPLGLNNTCLSPDLSQLKALAAPYRKDRRNVKTQPWSMGQLAPPSAVYSSTADLCKIMQTQLKAYQQYAKDGISNPWVLTENIVSKGKKRVASYGYGLVSWGEGTYSHSGDMDGYAADYTIVPGKDYALVLLTSSGEDWIPGTVRKIRRIMLE